MTLQGKRLQRVNYIFDLISEAAENGQVWNEEKLISHICITIGAARRYVLEILKQLEATKKIVRDLGEVYLPEQFRKLSDGALNKINPESDAENLIKEFTGK